MHLLNCDYCKKDFEVTCKTKSNRLYHKAKSNLGIFCTVKCRCASRGRGLTIIDTCKTCKASINRNKFHRTKYQNGFCSKSCAATFNNTHKSKGTRRSKLELWIESQLTNLYDFELQFNRKDVINAELDIYIPSLKLAFELNGVFHYEPIYGQDKLKQIQSNDTRKFQACLEQDIELCIIDTSQQKYFKESTSNHYLDIITSIINGCLTRT